MTVMLAIEAMGLVVALPGAALAAIELYGRLRKWRRRRRRRRQRRQKQR
jgi:uncharacterized protein (DUF2062 family)